MFVITILCCLLVFDNANGEQRMGSIKYGIFYNVSAVKTGLIAPDLDGILPKKNIESMGFGNYYGLFLLYDLNNILDKKLSVGLRLSFLNHTANFDYSSIYEPVALTETNLNIKNTFDCISFTPVIQTNITGNMNALFGIQFNIPILAEGLFNHNIRDVVIYPTSFFQPRVQFGFNYCIAIDKNRSFCVIPEVNVIYGLKNDIGGNFKGSWKSNYFTAGISVQYDRQAPIMEDETEDTDYENILLIDTIKRIARIKDEIIKEGNVFPIDTIIKKSWGKTIVQHLSKRIDTMFIPSKTLFDIKVSMTALDEKGTSIRVDTNFAISSSENYIFLEEVPLLNKIFFDENSYLIPPRYNLKVDSEVDSNKSIIDIYHNTLNIIGQRMSIDTDYTIRLVGCNDNNTEGEKDNLELSISRAESIKKYLIDNWDINDNRIAVEARGLPKYPSLKESELLKMEENRRVEMYSNDNSLFNSVVNESRLLTSNFEQLRLDATILSSDGIKKYIVLQKINNKIIRDISVNTPNGINGTYNITEYLPINIQDICEDSDMEIILIVTTNLNDTKTNRISFPIKYSTDVLSTTKSNTDSKVKYVHTDIDKSYLILFDLNNASISNDAMNIIDNIKSEVTPNSQVYIVGYSDINGDEKYNRRLASNRADNIKKAINLSDAVVKYSTNAKPYDNSLPEGRFYSRAVEVNISTTKK